MDQLFQGLIALAGLLIFIFILFLMVGKDSDFSKKTLSTYAPKVNWNAY